MTFVPNNSYTTGGISTHTPLAGRDSLSAVLMRSYGVFLLTRPLRDVTVEKQDNDTGMLISTHTPLAGRDVYLGVAYSSHTISTHTPLAGRDDIESFRISSHNHFYSHAPCGT